MKFSGKPLQPLFAQDKCKQQLSHTATATQNTSCQLLIRSFLLGFADEDLQIKAQFVLFQPSFQTTVEESLEREDYGLNQSKQL